jgi:type I restriction enzyme S subunit
MDAFAGAIGVSDSTGKCTPEYSVLTPIKTGTSNSFYAALLRIMALRNYILVICPSVRERAPRFRFETFRDITLPFPPPAEQTAIAAFLDRETGKIDALVAEQRRLMELLKEKRQAVISHAVTQGLNPQAPMKDSGIEWLGKVPKHWTVATVRRIIEWIEQGWSPDCFARPAEPEEWGVVKSGCVNRGVFVEDENKALPENLEPVPEYEIHEGDVLMSRASGSPELVGSTAYILQTRPKLMLSDKIFRIHLEPQVDKKFFVAVFNSRVTRSQIERAISGADGLANNLPQSAMKTFFCAIPPLAEQKAIVAHLEVELGKFDTLTAEAQRAIDLLQERRTALISAAVTGQIDVRRLGASLSGDIAISKSKP